MINIATFNMAGITLPEKRQILLNFFLAHNLDLICLQEITFSHCTIFTRNYNIFSNLGPRKRGTAILVRQELRAKNAQFEPEGRLLSVEVEGLTFVCIYAPSGVGLKAERDLFFRVTIPSYCTTYKTPYVILGDFNAVEDCTDRRTNKTNTPRISNPDGRALRELVSTFDLTDVWRAFRKNEPGWTFHRSTGQARLDRIYAQQTVEFSDTYTHALPFSDHLALVARIKAPTTPQRAPRKPRGLWKLNVSVLTEQPYQDLVHRFLNECAQHPARNKDVGMWWEQIFKPGLKHITVGYCRKRARDQRLKRNLLQYQLDEIVNAPTFDWTRYSELKHKFLAWERETLKGYEIRSRVESSVEEEPSLFHV